MKPLVRQHAPFVVVETAKVELPLHCSRCERLAEWHVVIRGPEEYDQVWLCPHCARQVACEMFDAVCVGQLDLGTKGGEPKSCQ